MGSVLGWVLGGLAVGGLAVGGVYVYRRSQNRRSASVTRAAYSGGAFVRNPMEYSKGVGPLSPEPPPDGGGGGGGGGGWVQDFGTFAGGVSDLAGAVDRFV